MNQNKTFTTKSLVSIGMLSALSAVLMIFAFPLPFALPFYKVDISDLPALIGAFAINPIAGVIIVLLKNILHLLIQGSTTFTVGELANFLSGALLVFPASYLYHRKKSKKSVLIGLIVATVIMSLASCFINYFITLPAYINVALGQNMSDYVDMASQINGLVHNMFTYLAFSVLPFNLVKCVIVSILTLLLYPRVKPIFN